jgi:hypothetical protein
MSAHHEPVHTGIRQSRDQKNKKTDSGVLRVVPIILVSSLFFILCSGDRRSY